MAESHNAETVCSCGAYGGGVHTKSARCDGSREPVSAPPSVQSEPAFLIFYDDRDRQPELFMLGGNAEVAARQRFEQVLGSGWNAHLFQRIDDGKRSMR